MSQPKAYVVGFVFNDNLDAVILLRKTHPELQAGKLNGPGGLIEVGESPIGALIREIKEELGIRTEAGHWLKFHMERYIKTGNTVHFYAMYSDFFFTCAETTTEEEVVKIHRHLVHLNNPMYNLSYLIPMAVSYINNAKHRYFEG